MVTERLSAALVVAFAGCVVGSSNGPRSFISRAAVTILHSSGHPKPSALPVLADALDPPGVIPIPTAVVARYGELFGNVEVKDDGAWRCV